MTDVVERPDEHRFVVEEDGHVAELVYRIDDGVLVLVHTGVPDELGGRGIGGRLVTVAVERAERDGLAIRPECPFARGWLRGHPDVASRAPIDWPPGDD
jgi:predicted GNAT family acetyltransferase